MYKGKGTSMRIAGLDIGDVRIGIALSDESEFLASGVESYSCVGQVEQDAKAIAGKLQVLGAGKVVFGLPRNMNGTDGPATEKVRAFARAFAVYSDIPQAFMDERLTTAQAQRTLIGANVSRKKRKNVVDKMAAQIILQNYLDAKGGGCV